MSTTNTTVSAAPTKDVDAREVVMSAVGMPVARPSLGPSNGKRDSAEPRSRLKIAYLVSRFPALTETFVLYEMLAIEQHGMEVELFSLQRERTQVINVEAVPFVERAHFHPLISWAAMQAHGHYLMKKPRAYAGALWTLLRANWGSVRMFFGALAFFPKTVLFAREMESAGITYLHAHFASHPAAAAYVIHRLTGIPYSFTAHGSDLHRDQHMLAEKVAGAAAVIAISEYNRQMIIGVCEGQFGDKIKVIHCGVDTRVFVPRTGSTPCDRGEGPLQILCIGTLHEVKGQTYLIEACRLLKERGIDYRCHFVGDGPDRAALTKQAAQAGVLDRITFHGKLTRPDVAKLLGRADVVATPSVPSRDGRREGIPVVLMEAMGCGLPVVASDLSGIPELVQDEVTGYLVPPGDATGMADALERLCHEPGLRRRLGRAGREKVLQDFNLRLNAAALVECFRREGELCA